VFRRAQSSFNVCEATMCCAIRPCDTGATVTPRSLVQVSSWLKCCSNSSSQTSAALSQLQHNCTHHHQQSPLQSSGQLWARLASREGTRAACSMMGAQLQACTTAEGMNHRPYEFKLQCTNH
jgi:hypothetical protein